MIQLTPQMRILVGVEAVDFRKGIDGRFMTEGVNCGKVDDHQSRLLGSHQRKCGIGGPHVMTGIRAFERGADGQVWVAEDLIGWRLSDVELPRFGGG